MNRSSLSLSLSCAQKNLSCLEIQLSECSRHLLRLVEAVSSTGTEASSIDPLLGASESWYVKSWGLHKAWSMVGMHLFFIRSSRLGDRKSVGEEWSYPLYVIPQGSQGSAALLWNRSQTLPWVALLWQIWNPPFWGKQTSEMLPTMTWVGSPSFSLGGLWAYRPPGSCKFEVGLHGGWFPWEEGGPALLLILRSAVCT